jgi:protein phosphatase
MLIQFFQNIFTKNSVKVFTSKGRKPKQEDAFYISKYKNATLLVFVADGVGGHGNGDFVSNFIVKTFKSEFESCKDFSNIPEFLKKTTYLAAASVLNEIAANPAYKNSGSTISGFFISNSAYYTVNVGDSRVYQFSKSKLTRITKDQSIVQQLMDAGQLTEAEAQTHPKRKIMTSAIGQGLDVIKIDINGPFVLKSGDLLFALTDGVYETFTDEQIGTLIKENINNKNLAHFLVNSAFNNGSTDNITACVYKHK